MQTAATSCSLVRDAIDCTHELGVVISRSGKFKSLFTSVATELTGSFSSIKPLCPTRWLCRGPSIQRVLEQYEAVLQSLERMSTQNTSETTTKVRGLLLRFQDGVLFLGLEVAMTVIAVLEELNTALQARDATVSGMLEAVTNARMQLSQFRSDDNFQSILASADNAVRQLDLKPISLPRQRRLLRRVSGTAAAYVTPNAEEHYRAEYFAFIDTALTQLDNRFNPQSRGLARYLIFEQVLSSGQVPPHTEVLDTYPELHRPTSRLSVQLSMVKLQFNCSTLSHAKRTLQEMKPEVRAMFSEVEQLVRLMLLCPVSSCEAERSFSSLRRLKTWLRNTMTQERLNAVVVCHVHQDVLDNVDISELAADFAGRSDIRKSMFGNGPF